MHVCTCEPVHKFKRARDNELCQSEADRSTRVSGALCRFRGRRAATRERFLSSAARRYPVWEHESADYGFRVLD